jgi:NADH:ubiquinone oxidoreductase subunit C
MGSSPFRKEFVEKNDKRNRNIEQLMADLPSALQAAILEKVRFGRSENTSYWVQGDRLRAVCEHVKTRGEMDGLENLSCVQVDQNLLITYFLRSSTTFETVILRVSLELPTNYQSFVDMDSVEQIWESAKTFEDEVFKLFGVRFGAKHDEAHGGKPSWDGFPLRKDFIFNAPEGLT